MKSIVIGTRGSALALWQAEYIKIRLKNELGIESSLKIIKTRGDKILDTSLAKIGGKGLFTKELEEMLFTREIDIAVHSLKDVPVDILAGLELACITEREEPSDCFLSYKYQNLDSLPLGAKIGTTSLRRSMQLNRYRSDFDTISLRGNVQTRLAKLESQEFHAIILAKAGIKRLAIDNIPYIEQLDFMIPAMGQGALGIECREDFALIDSLKSLHHRESAICVGAERAFVRQLEGGCQVPIGIYVKIQTTNLFLQAIVGTPDGKRILESSKVVALRADEHTQEAEQEAQRIGAEFADEMIAKGAKEILALAYKMI